MAQPTKNTEAHHHPQRWRPLAGQRQRDHDGQDRADTDLDSADDGRLYQLQGLEEAQEGKRRGSVEQ